MSLVLKNVRLAFPKLFTPEQYQGTGKPRYNATFIIDPASEEYELIAQSIIQVGEEKFGKKAAALLAGWKGNSSKFCFIDGNIKSIAGSENMWVLTTHRPEAKGPPRIMDRAKNVLTVDDGTLYAGCYVNASVDVYAQDDAAYPGIRCSFKGVQFFRPGDAFSGSAKSTGEEFEDLSGGDAPFDDDI